MTDHEDGHGGTTTTRTLVLTRAHVTEAAQELLSVLAEATAGYGDDGIGRDLFAVSALTMAVGVIASQTDIDVPSLMNAALEAHGLSCRVVEVN
jgi:hypothetical protein